jgi:hypothetical protein
MSEMQLEVEECQVFVASPRARSRTARSHGLSPASRSRSTRSSRARREVPAPTPPAVRPRRGRAERRDGAIPARPRSRGTRRRLGTASRTCGWRGSAGSADPGQPGRGRAARGRAGERPADLRSAPAGRQTSSSAVREAVAAEREVLQDHRGPRLPQAAAQGARPLQACVQGGEETSARQAHT